MNPGRVETGCFFMKPGKQKLHGKCVNDWKMAFSKSKERSSGQVEKLRKNKIFRKLKEIEWGLNKRRCPITMK